VALDGGRCEYVGPELGSMDRGKMSNIVYGGGPSAVRAAAVLSDSKLLEPTAYLGGIVEPRMPEGTGLVPASGNHEKLKRLYGQTPASKSDYVRALWARGRSTTLPINPISVKQVVNNFEWGALMAGHLRLRTERLVRAIRGGGNEERSYRDWVIHRFGEGAYRGLHAPYARVRWGEPSEISHAFAERFHGGTFLETVSLGSTPAEGWAALTDSIADYSLNSEIKRIEFGENQISHVVTQNGEEFEASTLWYAGSIPKLYTILPEEVSSSLEADMKRLECRDRIQIALKAKIELGSIPDELHIIGGGSSIFMATKLSSRLIGGEERLLLHLSQPSHRKVSDEQLVSEVLGMCSSLGLPHLKPDDAWVRRYEDYDPAWLGAWHPVHTRVMLKLEQLGIRLIGRSGAYRHMDPGEELNLAFHANSSESVHESTRLFGDTPVIHDYDTDNSKLDSFVMR